MIEEFIQTASSSGIARSGMDKGAIGAITLVVSIIGALASLVILYFMIRQRNPRPVLVDKPRFEIQNTPNEPRDTLRLELILRNPGTVALWCQHVELRSNSLTKRVQLEVEGGSDWHGGCRPIDAEDTWKVWFGGKVPEQAASPYAEGNDIPVDIELFYRSGRSNRFRKTPGLLRWSGLIPSAIFQQATRNRDKG